nr:MAG TPA: hypothetical protein [Caudoviricetes sp.]
MKIKDNRPTARILLPLGQGLRLLQKFGYSKDTTRKYLHGSALTPESQARAKKVREFALNYCNGVYMPTDK